MQGNNEFSPHAGHYNYGHNHSGGGSGGGGGGGVSNRGAAVGSRHSAILRNSQLLMSMHNGVVSGAGSNPVDATGGPSMAAATRDMDMDEEELQMAIRQSILLQEAQQQQQQQRRRSASTGQDAVGAVRDAESLSGLAAFAEEDGYLGSDHESAQRPSSSAAPEGTDIFAQIYESKVSDNRSWFLTSHG